MAERVRPWLYYDLALALCSTCLRRVEAKIVFQDGCVWLDKRCPRHGKERVLLADDVDYWRRARELFLKPSEMPARWNTAVRWGCPYDCGLCPDHEQHSCLTLIELGDGCNLECPVCYAASSPKTMRWHSLATIERMLDAVVANEVQPDVVQLSGGEPTLHPEFEKVLELMRERPIRHRMLNTNGLRIANEDGFAELLAAQQPGFEIYLQFDSFEEAALVNLRGADLRRVRERALAKLNALDVSTTLVVTVKQGVNDHELGKIVDFALQQPCVRGVTFQPIQDAGRNTGYAAAKHRLTLTGVRRRILEQTRVFRPEDVLPVPCHPDAIAMAYALKMEGRVVPLTGMIDPKVLIDGARNTIVYEGERVLHTKLFELLATNHSPESSASTLKDLLCCLPRVALPAGLGYRNLFRVIILAFQDVQSLDVRSVKKSCVHIVHPEDGRLIPFETYNLFYRGGLEHERLAPLRAEVEPFAACAEGATS
ncbi:MAG: radical SAM protein [Planctomycetes bacterium]|nr:radical SAM protein [Planctomycetota bacterium]